MPLSEARKRANKKWNDANMSTIYSRLSIFVPKARKETIEAYAKAKNLSINGLVNELLRTELGVSAEEWKEGNAEQD